MSDEAKGGKAAGSGGLGKMLVTVVVTALVCAAAGFGVYKFVLLPRIEEEAAKAHEEAGKEAGIPPESVPVDLPEAQAAVVSADPSEKASMLVYTMSIVCNNLETKELVEKNKQWFIAMLADLHRNKTKKELDNKETQDAILKQALEEGNSLLRRLQKKVNPEVKIFQFLYLKYSVFVMP